MEMTDEDREWKDFVEGTIKFLDANRMSTVLLIAFRPDIGVQIVANTQCLPMQFGMIDMARLIMASSIENKKISTVSSENAEDGFAQHIANVDKKKGPIN
jgi:hypothetical protein